MRRRFLGKWMLAALLAVVLTVPCALAANYNDTADHWAAKEIATWSDRGIIEGSGGSFRPNDTITYEQMVTCLSSVAAWASMDGYELAQKNLSIGEWENYYMYSEWAQTSARNLDALGALVGDQQPQDPGTRETAAALLCALMEATHLIWG